MDPISESSTPVSITDHPRRRAFSLSPHKSIKVPPAPAEKALCESFSKLAIQDVKKERSKTIYDQIVRENFSFITKKLLQEMLPADRMKLLKQLKQIAKNETHLLYKKAYRGLKVVKNFHEQLRNDQLLSLIAAAPQKHWNDLCIAGETVISSKSLFASIFSQLEHSSSTTVLTFQKFCIRWLEINQGTVLVKKAAKQITNIITTTGSHFDGVITKQSEILKKGLSFALGEQKILKVEPCLPTSYDFRAFFSKLGSEKQKGSQKTIKQIAKDLLLKQIELFDQITPHDLISEKPSDLSNSIKEFIRHINQLSSYVVDTIFQAQDLRDKKRLIKFFTDVGAASLSLHDFSTAFAIGTPLNSSSLEKPFSVWQKVYASKPHRETLVKFKDLFWAHHNFKELRSQLHACKETNESYLPYLGMYKEDITAILQSPSLIFSENEDPKYNLDKVSEISQSIQECFRAKDALKRKYSHTTYTTNFVDQVLANHRPLLYSN